MASKTSKALKRLCPNVNRRDMFDTCPLCGADCIDGGALNIPDAKIREITGKPIMRERASGVCCERCDKPQWNVGDVYYQAEGELCGMAWDLGELGQPCATCDEAESDADQWKSDLSPRENASASTWVRKFKITAMDNADTIGSAVTID